MWKLKKRDSIYCIWYWWYIYIIIHIHIYIYGIPIYIHDIIIYIYTWYIYIWTIWYIFVYMYLQRLSFADGSYKCFISFCTACPVTATPRVEGEALKATVCACVEIIFETIQHHLWKYLIHHLHLHTHVDTSVYICANPHSQTWVYFQIRSIYVHATTYFICAHW